MDRLRKLFDSHPNPASTAGDLALEAVYAASQCSLVCTACADACLTEEGVASLRDCIRLDQECADICALTARLLSRPGRQDKASLDEALEACIVACEACAEECETHADDMEHCRICAEACRACAKACREMRPALVA